jgi:hypothetical protein
MGHYEFVQNYEDLSSEMGFQFKFHCDRCGDGFVSTFQKNPLGMAGGLLRGAGSLLGGVISSAGYGAEQLERAVAGPKHDKALDDAVQEIKPLFLKCRRCGKWICRQTCYNKTAEMCKDCAPVAEEEETSMRAEHVRDQVTNDMFLEENVRMSAKGKEVAAACPKCGAKTMGQKFCPSCGEKLIAETFCPKCGKKLAPGAKFCGECGAKIPGA